ncbi:protein kinase [candidate division KSB1 bacterium]|nr:protein kinase [candidate division KSB1 bacterium]
MIGKTISHYKILEKIGEGGMGVVYKAEDTKLKRTVALKFLPQEFTRDEEAKERFVHEAQAASALDHPNICTIYEINETEDGQTFIAMAYYEGETLKEKISKESLPIDEALDIASQVAQGLSKAHEKGIVHRDIKPGNIIVTNDGVAKIVDFGLAKMAGASRITRAGSTLGTAAYMSPEQARGEEVDYRTDIWALGVVLYEMLTGQLPFPGEYESAVIYSILNVDPKSPRDFREDIPAELEQVVIKMMKKEISQRYVSVTEFKTDLGKIKSTLMGAGIGVLGKTRRYFKPAILIPVTLIALIALVFLIRQIHRTTRIRWAKDVALPKIEELIDKANSENNIEAFNLAQKAEKYIPDDPKLKQLMQLIPATISIKTQPAGAKIYRKPFDKPESDWEFIGHTPIVSRRMPYYLFLWKVEKPGYETLYRLSFSGGPIDWNTVTYLPYTIDCILDKSGTLPPNMVRIPGTGEIADFFIDKYEVTNEQFKWFVENGGYQKKAYWKHPFIKNGREATWEEAVAKLRDTTGRLGPATWEGGSYPEGEDNYPVSGVSWYEAAAYAEFAEKSLPTIGHWGSASRVNITYAYHLFYPMCNFDGEGPVPVGTTEAITQFGVYDMAGNVREWCWNESEKGRCIRGGAWNDVTYMFGNVTQADPFDRSPKNGFRCVIYPDREKLPESLFETRLYEKPRDFYKETPVSDAIFNVYKDMFSYDKTDLKAVVEESDDRSAHWIHQKISFSAAYDNERMIIHLFLPRNSSPPFQTIICFPGAGSIIVPSSDDIENYWEFTNKLSFFVKNGRAVVYPVYKGTFERDGSLIPRFDALHEYKDYMIKVVKDFKRVIDYLETRPDINTEKIAYFGMNWGGRLGGLIPALEERIKVAILDVGGFSFRKPKPEVDPFNYVSRITIPTLMLNGRFDMTFHYETSAKPMFELLGTPIKDKNQIVYDNDHYIPRKELIKESLNWLDLYFGMVK